MPEEKSSVSVMFEPDGKVVSGTSDTLLELALNGNVSLRGECGGAGTCGKCRVQIIRHYGSLNELTRTEEEKLSDDEIKDGYRLACQAKILSGNCTVYIPPGSRSAKREISAVGLDEDVTPEPAVKKIHIHIGKSSFSDIRPDLERLRSELRCPKETEISLGTLTELPKILRKSGWDVTVGMYGNRIISVEPGDTTEEIFGISVDIGSSKVICHLVNLITGETIARANAENPQVMYGEDIVSRITYASRKPENLGKLRRLIADTINFLIDSVCRQSGISPESVYDMVFVGNSVMHHIFLGITPKYIGVAPFIPAVGDLVSFPAKDLSLNMNGEGLVTAIPLIGGYIGSDAVANLLITKIYEQDEISLVIDIGTNSEILLGNSEKILACSAPSGPSFEGAHISSGMKAVSGAIESVKIEDGNVIYRTIDDVKPKGICGSGVIDLVAELYREKIITGTGKFRDLSHPKIKVDGVPEFVIEESFDTGNNGDITITEKDINEFLLAKGSLKTGWTILAEKFGIEPSQIKKVYLAGSFGTHVNIENAVILDIIPGIKRENIVFAGETAVGGAKIALKSVHERRKLEKILEKVEYIELSVEKSFNRRYIRSIPISRDKN
ncbi:ASKHA domain-containing protein [Methanoplanus limicola]|uniref:Ferredoxin n=1 Tax=Methanoplanus limicola DSM 2279 TaxID=937775 RepID=H1Z2J4_9EURY|nr:ASKHA domain-containing protein [Methanoplanus limicola]EHQ35520.1 ferredoxin [Methanoplanus limicola DSM 2279]